MAGNFLFILVLFSSSTCLTSPIPHTSLVHCTGLLDLVHCKRATNRKSKHAVSPDVSALHIGDAQPDTN